MSSSTRPELFRIDHKSRLRAAYPCVGAVLTDVEADVLPHWAPLEKPAPRGLMDYWIVKLGNGSGRLLTLYETPLKAGEFKLLMF